LEKSFRARKRKGGNGVCHQCGKVDENGINLSKKAGYPHWVVCGKNNFAGFPSQKRGRPEKIKKERLVFHSLFNLHQTDFHRFFQIKQFEKVKQEKEKIDFPQFPKPLLLRILFNL